MKYVSSAMLGILMSASVAAQEPQEYEDLSSLLHQRTNLTYSIGHDFSADEELSAFNSRNNSYSLQGLASTNGVELPWNGQEGFLRVSRRDDGRIRINAQVDFENTDSRIFRNSSLILDYTSPTKDTFNDALRKQPHQRADGNALILYFERRF